MAMGLEDVGADSIDFLGFRHIELCAVSMIFSLRSASTVASMRSGMKSRQSLFRRPRPVPWHRRRQYPARRRLPRRPDHQFQFFQIHFLFSLNSSIGRRRHCKSGRQYNCFLPRPEKPPCRRDLPRCPCARKGRRRPPAFSFRRWRDFHTLQTAHPRRPNARHRQRRGQWH